MMRETYSPEFKALLPIQQGLRVAARIYTTRLATVLANALLVTLLFVSIQEGLNRRLGTSLFAIAALATTAYLIFLTLRWWGLQWHGSLDQILVNQGLELDKRGEHEQAMVLYKRALWRNPLNRMALNNMAYRMVMDDRGGTTQALRYAQLARLLTSPGSYGEDSVLDTLGWAYYKHGRNLKKAEKNIRASLALLSSSAKRDGLIQVLYHLMVVLNDLGDHLEASKAYRELLALRPESAFEAKTLAAAKELASTWS